jgi:HD-like signal output (HDOD) protein
MDIDKLIASPLGLPSIPKVIALLLNEFEKHEPNSIVINELLAIDPVLTARTLHLANSARFNVPRQIGTVADALAILGLMEVRDIVITAALISAFRQVGGVDMPQFWRFSLNTAKLVRRLFGEQRLEGTSAFTVGLVHAVGELVMHRVMPREMAILDAKISPFAPGRAKAERKLLGYSYAQVGGEFARAWNLPNLLTETVGRHDMPFERFDYEPLTGVLHVASWRCRAQEMGLTERELIVSFPDQVANPLHLELDVVLEREPIDWATQKEVQAFTA